jgi:hypothetical protein
MNQVASFTPGSSETSIDFRWATQRYIQEMELSWILHKLDTGIWASLNWFRIGSNGGTCDTVIEPSGSVKRGKFLDKLRYYYEKHSYPVQRV